MHVELTDTIIPQQPDPAHMTVTAAGVPAAPYQILETDYRTYSCVYSCLEYFGFRAEFAWVFGRTPTLSTNTRARCHQVLTQINVQSTKMVPVVQGEEIEDLENRIKTIDKRHRLDQG
ncbi:hypothetical protein Pmani_006922 [Petrolisthes manimaculis]|uniref:Lipocalin/cytosolic fatty-acid binding domain-containing protein n=1 Tax=Petrolisthes manimaculis TaxID=1843537 RepID=A0AAE1Q9N6_9EUCA|nr:hypothetical protein Pmani_006922 [Petrolisthes manimaculis]